MATYRNHSTGVESDRDNPFRSDADPIELAHISRSSSRTRLAHASPSRSRSRSPDPATRGRLRPDLYFGNARGQYAPVDGGRNESPGPSIRSGKASTYATSSRYQSKMADADTQNLIDARAGEIAQWHIHWTTPAIIAFLFIGGVGAAFGHHFFYKSLDGQQAKEQLKMIRYGTALAFFVKSTLVGTTIVCNRQRIWRTFRQKALTVNAIDGLFSAPEDPTQFFLNFEMIRHGKLATFMAACAWLIPIASVLSPAALTTELRKTNSTGTCNSVATLNFTREALFNFRDETDDGRGNSLNYYNTTDRGGKTEGYFDYFDQPSRNARRLAFSTAYMKRPQPRENARISFCGDGYNCTYPIQFMGPGYKCEDVKSFDVGINFTMKQLAPEGNFTYYASVDEHDYKTPQIDTIDGQPIQEPPYPASLGVFESEPKLFIGYSEKKTELYPDDSPYAKKWKQVHEPKMFQCVLHHVNYTFNMEYSPQQNATLKSRQFLDPVVDTTLIPSTPNRSEWPASPSANFIRPQDSENYKRVAAYHSLAALLRHFLRGNIEKTTDVFLITRTDMSETRLINGRTSYPQADLKGGIQRLFEDMLIALLSEPTLVLAETQDVPCERSQSNVVYVYYPSSLWIGYAAVIIITFLFILIGSWSMWQNGVASDVLFSRIMVTTRNPTLDHLSVGACLGGDPFPKELIDTKLRFGVLIEEERDDDYREGPLGKVEHCTFGTVGETKEIVKGGVYAGLKKWREIDAKTDDEKTLLLKEGVR